MLDLSSRPDHPRSGGPVGLLLALVLWQGAPAFAQDDQQPAGAVRPILDVMRELESERDAKCHSTACRVENYVFGTPLTDGARDARSALQKELVRHLWQRASAGGEVSAATLAALAHELVRAESNVLGDLVVSFPAGARAAPVRLSAIRVRQYASIAYALRAILAVQQDELLVRGPRLAPLDEDGIAVLKDAVDTVTLCALALADEDAREASADEVDAARLTAAWRTLVPESRLDVATPDLDAGGTERAFDVLRGLIAEKTAAYERYNGLDRDAARQRFAVNVERFYALYQVTPDPEASAAFLSTFENAVVSFALQLLVAAADRAAERGHALVRADDAVWAVQVLTPHEVDTLEDVHFFPNLPPAKRVTLEAYDCDSFRDLGFHWGYIGRALDAPESPSLAPDPFAAEVLAESVSQYAVLVLRVAGDVARSKGESPGLRDVDLQRAVQRILKRAREHHDRPTPATTTAGIRSVPTRSPRSAADGARFVDVTADSGVAFLHRSSDWLSRFRRERTAGPPTFSGGGVAAEDVDGDGDQDLLLVGGLGLALYKNDGGGRFDDVTAEAGLSWVRPDGTHGEARTPLLVDLDNDGRLDVLVTYANDDHRLWRNVSTEGRLRFEDATYDADGRAVLGGAGLVGGPATVFDFDGDGLLDVYLAYFGDYLSGAIPTVDRDNRNGLPNRLFRNLGALRFEDVTEGSGTDDTGWCQAVSHADLDRDGRQDLFVANDFGRNVVLRNLGGGRFENVAPALGVTNAFHSMNVGVTDLNADGFPDVYVSNIATLVKDNKYVLPDVYTPMDFDYESMATMMVKESDVLYLSRGEEGRLVGYVPAQNIERGSTSTGWAWDAEFFDHDHDGDDDLYVVNGTNDYNYYATVHRTKTEDGEVVHRRLSHARESNVFFENDGGSLRNASEGSGADLLLNSRSTTFADLDGDGDLDVVVNNFHSPAVVLRNDAPRAGTHWLQVRLIGDPQRGSSRDAIGARLVATTPEGLRLTREVQGGSGYLSMNPRTLHLGLGAAERADLEVVWPDGSVQQVADLAADRTWTIRQGGEAVPSER